MPPIPDHILGLIAEGIKRAWQDLLSRHLVYLQTGSEAEINALLAIRLNALIEENDCWRSLVVCVIPTPGLPSYDGKHIEKKPDLVLLLTMPQRPRHPSYGLHVECKLLDHPNGKTVDLYCHQGLARFIKGEYAWVAREAFMLAYVRDDATIASTLTPFLINAKSVGVSDPFQTLGLPRVDAMPPLARARSCHARTFALPANQSAPGPICLWHLWLTTA